MKDLDGQNTSTEEDVVLAKLGKLGDSIQKLLWRLKIQDEYIAELEKQLPQEVLKEILDEMEAREAEGEPGAQ